MKLKSKILISEGRGSDASLVGVRLGLRPTCSAGGLYYERL